MPEAKTKPAAKKTRAPRKAPTAAELKAELEKAKLKVAELEQKAYAGELEEAIKATSIVADYAKLRAKVATSVTDVALIAAIGKAVGIKRLVVSQAPAAKRASKKATTA